MLRRPLRVFGAFGKRTLHVLFDSLPAIIPECRARSPNEPFVLYNIARFVGNMSYQVNLL